MSPKAAAAFLAAMALSGAASAQSALVPTSSPSLSARPATALPPAPDLPDSAPARYVPAPRFWEYEFDLRYAVSTGRKAFTLRGNAPYAYPVSRLSYQGDVSNGVELAGRIANADGPFLRYYAGFGLGDADGTLRDQDFPPTVTPYSQTISRDRGSSLAYGTVDAGYMALRTPYFGLGGFVGFEYLGQKDVAYGCTQVGGNPDICAPGQIAKTDRAVGESENWLALRVGAEARFALPYGFGFVADAAYLPYAALDGADTHYQRLDYDFVRSTPVTGHGDGYEVEGKLDYHVNQVWTLSVGARYTDLNADGKARFDRSAVPVGDYAPQPVHYETQRLLGYLSTGIHF